MKKQSQNLSLLLFLGALWLAGCGVAAYGAWSVLQPLYSSWGALLAVLWCPLCFLLYELIGIAVGMVIALARSFTGWLFSLRQRAVTHVVRQVEADGIAVRADWYTNHRLCSAVFLGEPFNYDVAAIELVVTNKRSEFITISPDGIVVRQPSHRVFTSAAVAKTLKTFGAALIPRGFGYARYEMVLLPLIFPFGVSLAVWELLYGKITLARNGFRFEKIEPGRTRHGFVYFYFDGTAFPDGQYVEISFEYDQQKTELHIPS